jgi:hypothetical protein
MNHATAAKAVHTPKTSKPTPSTITATEPVIETEPTIEQIRQRAYELYLFRGERPGDAVEDWLEAERELRAKRS